MPRYQIQTFILLCFFGLWLFIGVFVGQRILGLEFYSWLATFKDQLYFWGFLVGIGSALYGLITLIFYGLIRDFKIFKTSQFLQIFFAFLLWGTVFGGPIYLMGNAEFILSAAKILIIIGNATTIGMGIIFLCASLGEIFFRLVPC